jgi:hypothetical protein
MLKKITQQLDWRRREIYRGKSFPIIVFMQINVTLIRHKFNLNHVIGIDPHFVFGCSVSENTLGRHYLVVAE